MTGFLCSTGAMNRHGMNTDPYKLTELYPSIECDGYELLIHSGWTSEAIDQCSVLTEAGINIPVIHLSKRIGADFSSGSSGGVEAGLKLLRANCALAQRLNIKMAVIHLWSFPDSNFDFILKGYTEAVAICHYNGIEALAESLPCWERPLSYRMKQLAEVNPECRFTIDSRHIRWNNMTETIFNEEWLWKENRIAHVHISDCGLDEKGNAKQTPILHPGEGVIDFESFFTGLKVRNYSGYITLESPAEHGAGGGIDVSKINKSLKTLRELASNQ